MKEGYETDFDFPVYSFDVDVYWDDQLML